MLQSKPIRYSIYLTLSAALLWAATATFAQQAAKQVTRNVDAAQLRKAPAEEWLTYGRDQAETHFSPLKQIDASNIGRLGLAVVTNPDVPAGNLQGTPGA